MDKDRGERKIGLGIRRVKNPVTGKTDIIDDFRVGVDIPRSNAADLHEEYGIRTIVVVQPTQDKGKSTDETGPADSPTDSEEVQ